MKWLLGFALTFSAGSAFADDDDDDGVERVTGKRPPELDLSETKFVEPPKVNGKYQITEADLGTLEYNLLDYQGANQLGMEPKFVRGIRDGLELVFQRDYKGVTNHFAKFEMDNPDSAVRSVAEVLVWQARMLENFDYRYEAQYWTASAQARASLEAALKTEGNEAWEHFLTAGVAGIEAIHTMRRSKYLKALQLAFEAVDEVQQTRELAPGFADLAMADGMYNYWRTVVTMNSSVLPDFGDHRVEGIQQMEFVEDNGVFLSRPATLALVFTWIEEGDMRKALAACSKNRRRYPDNVINNVVTGTTLVYSKKYDSAITVLDEVFETDPDNDRAHYWKGLALMRTRQLDPAIQEWERYLSSKHLETYHRSQTHYRIGFTKFRQKKYWDAEAELAKAVKIDGHKNAKRQLDRLKQMKKDGKVDY